MSSFQSFSHFRLAGAVLMGVALTVVPAVAQTRGPAGAINNVAGTAGQAVNNVAGAAGNVVGGLNPTLQPVTQGVGGALNNLTQPDTVNSLLDFLSTIVPNHIEAHVNLDALSVKKLTVDIQGVDLRNLRIDLLVANSKGGKVQPAMGPGSTSGGSTTDTGTAGSGSGSTGGTGTGLPGYLPNTSSPRR